MSKKIIFPTKCEECPFYFEEETRCYTYGHCGFYGKSENTKYFNPWEETLENCKVTRIDVTEGVKDE